MTSTSTAPPRRAGFLARLRRYVPAPHKVDLRSLVALRILLACYFLIDINMRFSDGYASFSWYISDTNAELPPIFLPSDTMDLDYDFHHIWCYRGTVTHQMVRFIITTVLAILFGLGCFCYNTVPFLLWVSVSSMQCTAPNADYNDGSDNLASNMVLWCTVLPGLNQLWSVDSMLKARKKKKKDTTMTKSSSNGTSEVGEAEDTPPVYAEPIATAATLGLTIQVSLVYLGIVDHRLSGTMWWYPELSAVYYAISTTTYTREALATFIQRYPVVSTFMTAGAMISEGLCPLLCFLAPYDVIEYDDKGTKRVRKSWRYIPALLVTQFHLVLWACIRIPAYQWICAINTVVWLPGSFWDGLQSRLMWRAKEENTSSVRDSTKADVKEKDGGNDRNGKGTNGVTKKDDAKDTNGRHENIAETDHKVTTSGVRRFILNAVRLVASWFLLVCMLNVFAIEQEWLDYDKHFHTIADIGFMLQFSQYWKIFGPDAPTSNYATLLTGRYSDEEGTRKDMLAAIKTHDWTSATDITDEIYQIRQKQIPLNMSEQFSTWRWEGVFTEPVGSLAEGDAVPEEMRMRMVLLFLCAWSNQELQKLGSTKRVTHIDLEYLYAEILPMDFKRRFRYNPSWWDVSIEVKCMDRSCCRDKLADCPYWAENDECFTSPEGMLEKCPRSCGICGDHVMETECEDDYDEDLENDEWTFDEDEGEQEEEYGDEEGEEDGEGDYEDDLHEEL